jgi:heme-degrading monooxygenase HmoA
MFTHLAIHYPKQEYYADLLASMRRLDAAAQGMPGLIRIGDWTEVDGGARLVGIATWESREAFDAAAPSLFAVVADDPFALWQERRADNFFLERD